MPPKPRLTCKCTNVPKKGGGKGTRIIKVPKVKVPKIKGPAKKAPAKKATAKKATAKKAAAKKPSKGTGAKCKCS